MVNSRAIDVQQGSRMSLPVVIESRQKDEKGPGYREQKAKEKRWGGNQRKSLEVGEHSVVNLQSIKA